MPRRQRVGVVIAQRLLVLQDLAVHTLGLIPAAQRAYRAGEPGAQVNQGRVFWREAGPQAFQSAGWSAISSLTRAASSSWTRRASWTRFRAGHERWCRRALAVLSQTGTAGIDDAWCARFDRIADDAGAALAWSAGRESRRVPAAELAAELAGLLFLR